MLGWREMVAGAQWVKEKIVEPTLRWLNRLNYDVAESIALVSIGVKIARDYLECHFLKDEPDPRCTHLVIGANYAMVGIMVVVFGLEAARRHNQRAHRVITKKAHAIAKEVITIVGNTDFWFSILSLGYVEILKNSSIKEKVIAAEWHLWLLLASSVIIAVPTTSKLRNWAIKNRYRKRHGENPTQEIPYLNYLTVPSEVANGFVRAYMASFALQSWIYSDDKNWDYGPQIFRVSAGLLFAVIVGIREKKYPSYLESDEPDSLSVEFTKMVESGLAISFFYSSLVKSIQTTGAPHMYILYPAAGTIFAGQIIGSCMPRISDRRTREQQALLHDDVEAGVRNSGSEEEALAIAPPRTQQRPLTHIPALHSADPTETPRQRRPATGVSAQPAVAAGMFSDLSQVQKDGGVVAATPV